MLRENLNANTDRDAGPKMKSTQLAEYCAVRINGLMREPLLHGQCIKYQARLWK